MSSNNISAASPCGYFKKECCVPPGHYQAIRQNEEPGEIAELNWDQTSHLPTIIHSNYCKVPSCRTPVAFYQVRSVPCQYFVSQRPEPFKDGLENLVKRWDNVVVCGKEYILH